MVNANPLNTRAKGSANEPPLTHVPSCAAPDTSAYITSIGLHPVEPFQVVGLSSGEVCLYTTSTDALSWFVEMDAARQDRLRFEQEIGDNHNSNSRREMVSAVAVAPPDAPSKVLSFASLSSSASAAAAGKCAVVHCGFLRGREEDLIREVVQHRQPGLASSPSSSSLSVARHLLYVVTSVNDIFVADIKSELLLVRWSAPATAQERQNNSSDNRAAGMEEKGGGSSSTLSATSPLHPQFCITQVETYGALIFLTVARRSAVEEASATLGKGDVDGGRGPERNALDHCNDPFVYVLHLGYTKPFGAATTKSLTAGGGAYVIKAVSQDKRQLRDPTRSSTTRNSLSIRVHPFAPLLLLLLNRAEVQVFAVDGDESDVAAKRAQLVLFNSPAPSSSKSAALPSASSTPSASLLLDAQFVPSAAVLVRASDYSSSSSSKRPKWCCRNVQILLLSSTRLRLICTRPASISEAAGKGGTVAVDRAFYTAPGMGVSASGTASPIPSFSHSSHVRFVRAWTWLGSPDTFFVLQSDRTLLELSCNDFVAASMEVPSVLSRRQLPPRTVMSRAFAEARKCTATSPSTININNNSSYAQRGDWWLLPPTSGLPCAQCPDILPLWGRTSVLNGVFAPRLPAYHSSDPQTIVFSRLTGLARPLPIPQSERGDRNGGGALGEEEKEQGGGAPHRSLHLSLLADTETVSSHCISIRLCLTPQQSESSAVMTADGGASSPNTSSISAQRVAQESVNVNIARVLCDSAAPALCRLEHGFYFVGSREESAYSDYPFVVAGLQYVDSVVQDDSSGINIRSSICATQSSRDAQLRVAMVCLPADRRELRRLYDTAKAGCGGSGSGGGCGAFAPALTLPDDLKHTLAQAVRHAQVQSLPTPQFDFELPYSGQMSKQLLSCALQLSNDGVVPCVWGLWAPVFPSPLVTTSSVSATMGSHLPPPQSLQLTMQSFYVAAESQQLLWRPPELVQIDDLLASNPSQVFALSSVLTKGGCADASAAMVALPTPYTSIDDVLMDVDAVVVARLFLYYADRKVLLLATVETGSSRESGFNSETRSDVRQYLRLVPHAAAEMNDWKGNNTAESLSCALLSAVQLSAVLVNDHGEPALQVAVVSRRFGVALALFPMVGRRGIARVSTTLQPVKVYLYRRWEELLCVTASITEQAESERSHNEDGGEGQNGSMSSPPRRYGGVAGRTTTAAFGFDDIQYAPLLRRYRAWADTVVHPSTTYASVPLVQWVWPPALPGDDEIDEEKRVSAAGAANPILLLQRGRALYVLHQTGAAVQVCSSLLHCSPLQLMSREISTTAASSSSSSTRCELYLQYGSYLGLLARTRLLRQLQLQYDPYPFYAGATVSAPLTSTKVKWLKKFLKSANSLEAARRRAQERPRYTAWLQHVYTPTTDDLAYQFVAPSSEGDNGNDRKIRFRDAPQISGALERLVGTGGTHIGNVLDVNFTDPILLATLAVEAMAASHGMQKLVSAAGMLTDSLRRTLRHLTTVLEHNNETGNDVSSINPSGREAAPMCVMHGNWAVAEALARLPLGCVMTAMAQEVRRAAAAASNNDHGSNVKDDVRKKKQLADLQRWWWLLMRCSALIKAVNTVQADAANRVMAGVLEELPINSLLLHPPTDDESAMVHTISQALLLCSPHFLPHVVRQILESGAKSSTQKSQRLAAAVKAALAVLGAAETNTVPAVSITEVAAEDSTHIKTSPTNNPPTDRAAGLWSPLFSTVCMDGAHWTHAVYYMNVLTHIRNLANPENTNDEHSDDDKVHATAVQCLAGADAAVEASAAAVLGVATQTVGVLLGAAVDVPAASRSRMANAVAQSMSKRQQVLQSGKSTARVPDTQGIASRGASAVDRDVPFVEEDVYFLEQTPIDRLRHSLYAAQWRDLYGAFAYPTCYFFRSAAASSDANLSAQKGGVSATVQKGSSNSSLPYQLTYDACLSGARARETTANTSSTEDAASSSVTTRRHRGRVQKVLLTEQTPSLAAAVPPTMEIVPMPSSPQLSNSHTNRNNNRNHGGGIGRSAEVVGPQQQQSQLSLRAAVAKEEADLLKTYFNGFASREEEEGHDPLEDHKASATSGGRVGDVRNDSLARNFEAQLRNTGAADEDVSASAVQRERQRAADRQRIPDASSFAPSVTRRTTNTAAATAAADGAAPGENAYGDHLYGAVPSQQTFFARFQAEEEG